MTRFLLFSTVVLLFSACATSSGTQISCFHAYEDVEKDIGYCQAVRVGDTLHISGVVGQGEMPDAIKEVYEALQQTLAAHGLSYVDVVRETVYATDLDAFIEHKEIRKAYYGSTFPAATWVQVERLYLPVFVVEVELTAVFRE